MFASLSAGFSQALSYLWPAATQGAGRVVAIVVPLLVLTALNVVGILLGARTANALLIGKQDDARLYARRAETRIQPSDPAWLRLQDVLRVIDES